MLASKIYNKFSKITDIEANEDKAPITNKISKMILARARALYRWHHHSNHLQNWQQAEILCPILL